MKQELQEGQRIRWRTECPPPRSKSPCTSEVLAGLAVKQIPNMTFPDLAIQIKLAPRFDLQASPIWIAQIFANRAKTP